MAKFDYRCTRCGLVSEQDEPGLVVYIHHNIDAELIDDLENLPRAQWGTVCDGRFKRVYSFGGVILKGPGFYKTDH